MLKTKRLNIWILEILQVFLIYQKKSILYRNGIIMNFKPREFLNKVIFFFTSYSLGNEWRIEYQIIHRIILFNQNQIEIFKSMFFFLTE